MNLVSAQTKPVPEVPRTLNTRNENIYINTGDSPTDRTIFTLISLFCMTVLSFLLGSRFTRLRKHAVIKRNFTSMLVLILYFTVITFIVCSAVMVAGQGLYTIALCTGGTWICVILYTFAKGIIYTFFVERIHIVRAPFFRRSRDRIYLSCMVLVLICLGTQVTMEFSHVVIEMHESDGRCHFGIREKATISGLIIDLVCGVGLTGLFFYLLSPTIKIRSTAPVSGVLRLSIARETSVTQNFRNETPVQRNIRTLLRKTIMGAMLFNIPFLANMIQFVITKGREPGMVCLSICVLDITWDTVVINWLTSGSSAEAERNLSRSTQASMRAPLIQRSTSIMDVKNSELEVKLGAHSLPREPPSALMPSAGVLDVWKET